MAIAYFFTLLFICALALAQESSQIHIYNYQIFYRKCTNIAKETDPYIHKGSSIIFTFFKLLYENLPILLNNFIFMVKV